MSAVFTKKKSMSENDAVEKNWGFFNGGAVLFLNVTAIISVFYIFAGKGNDDGRPKISMAFAFLILLKMVFVKTELDSLSSGAKFLSSVFQFVVVNEKIKFSEV